jgi:hypothetical protein
MGPTGNWSQIKDTAALNRRLALGVPPADLLAIKRHLKRKSNELQLIRYRTARPKLPSVISMGRGRNKTAVHPEEGPSMEADSPSTDAQGIQRSVALS